MTIPMMTPQQAKMARAARGYGLSHVSQQTQLSPTTISRVETGLSVNTSSIRKLEKYYTSQGVQFYADGSVKPPQENSPDLKEPYPGFALKVVTIFNKNPAVAQQFNNDLRTFYSYAAAVSEGRRKDPEIENLLKD